MAKTEYISFYIDNQADFYYINFRDERDLKFIYIKYFMTSW